MTSKRIRRPSLQIDAEARAHRAVAAAERAAERERRTPDALAIADRQAAPAALEAGAEGDAAAFAPGAGGVDRHEIGIGSCRERVCQCVSVSVVAASLKQNEG